MFNFNHSNPSSEENDAMTFRSSDILRAKHLCQAKKFVTGGSLFTLILGDASSSISHCLRITAVTAIAGLFVAPVMVHRYTLKHENHGDGSHDDEKCHENRIICW